MRNKSFIFLLILLFSLFQARAAPAFLVMPSARADGHAMGSPGDTLKALGLLVEKNKASNNADAIRYARAALSFAARSRSVSDRVDAYKWLGKAYLQNQKDSSYFYYNRALHIADSCGLTAQKIHVFYNLAVLSGASSNYKSALALLDSSARLALASGDGSGVALAYNEIGNINYRLHDYVNARKMYESALEIARRDTHYVQMGMALANLARKPFENDEKKSIAQQKEAISYLGRASGTEEQMAVVFINIGTQQVNPDSALYYYKAALNLGLHANLPKILFGAYNNMAYSYLDKKDLVRAEECLADQAIPRARELKDYDWLSSLYDSYADVCVEKGDFKKALELQKLAMKTREIDNRQRGSDQVRLLAAQLDLKNKELIIQNEEKELLKQTNRLQQTELWLAIALLLVVASVFTTLVLQQRNRTRFAREQISSAKRILEMEETEKGRTARELHDLTGQLVLGISGTIESVDFPDEETKEAIRTRIRELGASIRRISHRMNRAMIEHFTFSEMIMGLCEDMQKLSKLKVNLDIPEQFPDLPNDLVLHFYRITQELLTNAGKYAADSHITLKIFHENGRVLLKYADDGPGFTQGPGNKPSMGIRNIYERAKLVGGQATLSTAAGKGTQWNITFPINP